MLYFIVFIFVGSMFLMNLFIGVVYKDIYLVPLVKNLISIIL